MAKLAKLIPTIFTIALLLSFQLTYAVDTARPHRALKTQQQEIEAENIEVEDGESCEGLEKDECLMRRTLAAHVDYIYTQKHKP